MPISQTLKLALLVSASTTAASAAIDKFSKKASEKIEKLKTSSEALRKGAMDNFKQAAFIAAPLFLAGRAASELEDRMVDVARATNVDIGSKELKRMTDGARNLSDALGDNQSDVLELMKALAQGGTTQNEIVRVTKDIEMMSKATGVASDLLADSYTKMRKGMNLTTDQAKLMLEAVNASTKKFGGAPAELMDFLSRNKDLGNQMGLSSKNLIALGNSFQAVGLRAEDTTDVLSRFYTSVAKSKTLSALYNNAGGGTAGLEAILSKANKSGNALSFLVSNGLRATNAKPFAQLASAMHGDKGLLKQMGFIANNKNIVGSINKDAEDALNTSGSQIKILKEHALNLAIDLGNALLPSVLSLVRAVTPLIDSFSKWATNNPKLLKTIVGITAGLAGYKFALGGLKFGVATVKDTMSIWTKAKFAIGKVNGVLKNYRVALAASKASKDMVGEAGMFTKLGGAMKAVGNVAKSGVVKGFKAIGSAFTWVGRLMMANPWLIAILAIAAAVYLIIKYWKPIKDFFIKLWKWVKDIFLKAWNWIKDMFLNFTPYGLVIKHWSVIADFFKGLWDKVKDAFMSAINWIKSKWDWINNTIIKPLGHLLGFDGGGSIRVENAAAKLLQPVPIRAGSNDRFTFNPVIQVSGSIDQRTANSIVAQTRRNFALQMQDYQRNKERKMLR